MEEREIDQRELILVRYEKLKKKVKDWENAIYKTEGRKPGSSDMKDAPKEVQVSYREYMKIRKYLGDNTNMPTIPKNLKLLTPGKLFLAGRVQTHRSELSNSVRTPVKMFRKSGSRAPKSTVTSKTLGLRSSSHSGVTTISSEDMTMTISSDSSAGFTFTKLYKGDKGKGVEKKSEHQDEGDYSTSAEEDDSTSENALEDNSSLNGPNEEGKTSHPFGRLRSFHHLDDPGSSNAKAPDEDETFETEEMDCAESESTAIPASLKSPREKGKMFSISSRKVDCGWLERLNEDDNELFEDEREQTSRPESDSANTSESDLGIAKSPVADKINYSSESISVGEEYTAMDVAHQDPPTDVSSATTCVTHENTNTDSGICLSSMFNAEELHQAVQEVLDDTKTSTEVSAVPVSDADGSLLYSLCEDACHPSDHDEPVLDSRTMSNILNILSDNISNDDENENIGAEAACPDKEDSISRKRPAKFAFSPSPKKPAKPRKFFKSSRGERARPAYYGTVYKPASPIKKPQKSLYSSSYSSSAPTKIVLKKVSSEIEEPVKPLPIQESKDVIDDQSRKKRSPRQKKSARPTSTVKAGSSRTKKKVNYVEDDQEEVSDPKPSVSKKNIVIDVFDEASAESSMPSRKRGGNRMGERFRKKETLESKMNSGRVDDNYVRIDTKRKVFVRGHKKISVTKMKRLDWKNRKMNQGKEAKAATSNFTCHKCGEKGHFAKFCKKGTTTAEEIVPVEQQDNSPFPSLEEAARMVYKCPTSNRVNIYTSKSTSQLEETQCQSEATDEAQTTENETLDPVPEEPAFSTPQLIEAVDPVFSDESSCDPELEEETMLDGLRAFGYENFRPGQKEAVLRVLKGMSTLLILSTGSGKSLCYQLPAYLYGQKYPGALTLCISPLVSLMEDQVQGIPPFLNAACLHSNMTSKQKDIVLEKVKSKKLHILLVSPEAVCGGLFGILRGNTGSLPKISFACIDEVHCVSQWSHNFRPSYLQLCKILREKLNVQTILGLTATATTTTAESICEHLSIAPSTTIRGELIPGNLNLSVSRDLYRDEALITILRGERFCNCDSIIIYCTRRDECERIATFVRTKLQEIKVPTAIKSKSGARLSASCEAYHAGMTARRRKNVQEGFMSGAIRIVVATVAFGMGIDKSDIRAVIHYNMPRAFESYVQEIGRAGRDGLPAHCHLFLDNAKRSDLCELKRHVYANSVDRPTIRKLLRKIFQTCKCKRIQKLKGEDSEIEKTPCQGHEVSFSIEKCVMDLDLPKENITTLLCYLELGQKKWIEILPLTYETCKIRSYGGPKALKFAATRCPPLAVAIALQREKNLFHEADAFVEFNVIEAAATVGWNSGVVKKELKQLEWVASQYDDKGNPTRFRKSGLMVEFSELAYRLRSQGSLSDESADEVLNSLHGRNLHQERTQLHQLNRVYQALLSVSFPNINNLCNSYDEEKSDKLKTFIYEYFSEDGSNSGVDLSSSPDVNLEEGRIEDLRQSIRRLIDSNRDINFTGRSIAKIFQGISSPCFPADVWYRNRDFWRRYLDADFHFICRIASEEL